MNTFTSLYIHTLAHTTYITPQYISSYIIIYLNPTNLKKNFCLLCYYNKNVLDLSTSSHSIWHFMIISLVESEKKRFMHYVSLFRNDWVEVQYNPTLFIENYMDRVVAKQ
jgi:hypothetical protein